MAAREQGEPGEQGARILVVDDDPGLLELIEMRLGSNGYEVICAASGEEALALFRQERPRVVVSDLRMDGMDGHALFSRLHAEAPTVPIIMLTAHGTIPDAVAATQRGVFAFLTKPFDGHELLARVADALAISPPVALATGADAGWRSAIISSSLVMDEVLRQAQKAIAGSEPILISGPRGSGKELLARAIHQAGERARRPLFALRCGEHNKGDFLPSPLSKGLKAIKGGILLLDDFEELSLADQASLLPLVRERVPFLLQGELDQYDVRVIALTSAALEPAVRDGRLRADLFYGLSRTVLNLPALAERSGDIPALIAHFVAQGDDARRGFSPEAIVALQEASWSGNIRQLRNIVELALAQSITSQVPLTVVKTLLRSENEKEISALDEARKAFEYDYLVQLLEATKGNVTHAARLAQRNRTEFYKLLAKHNVDPAVFK